MKGDEVEEQWQPATMLGPIIVEKNLGKSLLTDVENILSQETHIIEWKWKSTHQ